MLTSTPHSIFVAGTQRKLLILEMPATDSAAVVVARFLKANHYDEVSIIPVTLDGGC